MASNYTQHFADLGSVLSWSSLSNGIVVAAYEAEVVFEVWSDTIFRIQVRRPSSRDHASYAVVQQAPESSNFKVTETRELLRLSTEAATLTIHKAPFGLSGHRRDGTLLFEAPAPFAFLNDEFVLSRRAAPGDVVLGLGEKSGPLDRKGREFLLWNTDILNPNVLGQFPTRYDDSGREIDPTHAEFDPYYMSIPFYQVMDVTGRATGFFIDNVHRARFEFGSHDTTIRFDGGDYVEYVFVGPALADVLRDYTWLTGRMQPPPLWALGYHHCRWSPYTQADVVKLAERYRAKGIPCDSIWLDIDHMDGYRVFTWNKRAFPDPGEMTRELASKGFKMVTIVDPGVKVDASWDVYKSGRDEAVFCRTADGHEYHGQVWPGKTAFPDFATAHARDWWGRLNAAHVASGMAGIWNDMNEPATGDIPADAMRFEGGSLPHGAVHNAYALLMAMGTVEGLLRARPDERTFVLSRAGSAGIQRYAANWLGDNMSRWEHLALSVSMSLGLGLSGQPFVGADIGGFGDNCTPELLVRWFQAAALSPFCRHHNTRESHDQYPWTFGPEVEALCRQALELRYRLLPYLYGAFVESSETGAPVMRPIVWEEVSLHTLRHLDDEYLLGPDLLVAPALERGQTERRVAFPTGSWFDFYADEQWERGAATVRAPLARIPLFARAGAVIPMWPEAPASTQFAPPETLELHVFVPPPGHAHTSSLVEDDGATFAYRRGERLTTRFEVVRKARTVRLHATVEGAFADLPRRRFRIVLRGAGVAEPVEFDNAGAGFELEIGLPKVRR